jgi:hypothetical protein
VLLGGAVGLAAVAVHRTVLPLGLVLALGTTYAVALWLRAGEPRTAASYAAGWLLVFVPVVLGRPEGDFVLASDPPGWALLAGALGLLVLGVVSLPGRGRAKP